MKGIYRYTVAAAFSAGLSLAQAATVSVEAFSIASNSAGPGGSNASCAVGTRAGFDCHAASSRIGSRGDPLSVATDSLTHVDFFSNNAEATKPPNFVYDTQAHVSAELGALHASAVASVQGYGATPGATNVPPPAVSSRARAAIVDTLTVESSTLAKGTPITLEVQFDVEGNGPGSLNLDILSFFTGSSPENDLRLSSAATFGQSLQDIHTTFTVHVGSLVRLTYRLEALTAAFSAGWRPIDVLNGRFNSSDYGNTAHLYLRAVGANTDIRLNNGTTFNYAFPAPVPVPAGFYLLVTALPLLALRRRRSR